jgi:integrase
VSWRDRDGRYLLDSNPVRGFETPEVKNVRRPVASTGRYEALRAKSDQVLMEIRWGSRRQTVRSYLSEVLDVAHGTGRRLSAICSLRYEDLRLDEGPHGSIRWPSDTDKGGRETVAPISPPVRAALDRVLRDRPGIGRAPIFPSPTDPQKPISRYLPDRWLREAERLAGLVPQDGSLFHAFRRGWVVSRKHLPDVDVAAAGGWSGTTTLRDVYQQPDAATMLKVVLQAAQLREAK